MNKNDLIAAIAEAASITKTQAGEVLDGTLSAIQDSLSQGESVVIPNFGSFGVSQRQARTARNPRNGEKINVPAKKVVKFKAGKKLSEQVA